MYGFDLQLRKKRRTSGNKIRPQANIAYCTKNRKLHGNNRHSRAVSAMSKYDDGNPTV
jgi:hypothetical protein